MKSFFLKGALCAVLLFSSIKSQALPVSFQEGIFLKDAQADQILHEFTNPILDKAGISPSSVTIILVSTPIVNAAATIGGLIFVNTGLIMACENGSELAAVLAHEIGHLQKHHVITRLGAMENAAKVGLAGLGIGAALSALTGNAGPLIMSLMGAQHVAERSLLHFTRAQESEADQASFTFLQALGWPVQGSVTFMTKLMEDRGPLQDSRVVYNQTHPLQEERIRHAQQKVNPQARLPHKLEQDFQLLKVKVTAYGVSSSQVGSHPGILYSSYAAFGQAIGFHRQGQLDNALQKLDEFERLYASPYIHELRAQIFLEKNDLTRAFLAINKALSQAPPHATLYVLAAQIKIASWDASQDSKSLQEARQLLDKAIRLDPDDPTPWRFLSVVHGKEKREGEMMLCLAEEQLRLGQTDRAISHAKQAQKKLLSSSPNYQRSADLIHHLQTLRE